MLGVRPESPIEATRRGSKGCSNQDVPKGETKLTLSSRALLSRFSTSLSRLTSGIAQLTTLYRTSPVNIFSPDFGLENSSNRNGDGVVLEPCERTSQYNLLHLFTCEQKTFGASTLLEIHTGSVDMTQMLLESLGLSASNMFCCSVGKIRKLVPVYACQVDTDKSKRSYIRMDV